MPDRPSICFVSRKWPPAMGGMETYSHRLAAALEAHAEVGRIVLPGRPDGAPPGTGRLLSFGLAAAAKLLGARRPADVVHVADMASWPLALVARLRAPRTRLALSAHGTDVSYPLQGGARGRLYGAWLRAGARLLPGAVVIANSAATAGAATGLGFRDVRVVRLAAEVSACPDPAPRDEILFAGRLVPMKGCGWFVREVLPRLPDEVTLAVHGTAHDATEATALRAPRVRFGGRLDPPALRSACARALCVVVPNVPVPSGRFEGFGLIAVEAAAAGGLVLAADHGGLRDAVVDGTTGFLLPPGDADAWAGAILDLRAWSAARRAAFLAGSVAAVRRVFTWERVARETFAAYLPRGANRPLPAVCERG
jgi:glycosyltransferase involved in cell wall biosynthesis